MPGASVKLAIIAVFSKLSCTSRPITDHLPYLSYSLKCNGKDYGRTSVS